MRDELCYVLVWVDDIIIGCKGKDRINKLRDDFNQRFRMDDRGSLMTIKQQPGAVTVSQTKYINDCLRRYGLDDCKPVSTPADVNSSFSRVDCPEGGSTETAEMKGCDYRGIVGSSVHDQADSTGHSDNSEQTLQIPRESWQGSLDGCEASATVSERHPGACLTFRLDADGFKLFGALTSMTDS